MTGNDLQIQNVREVKEIRVKGEGQKWNKEIANIIVHLYISRDQGRHAKEAIYGS